MHEALVKERRETGILPVPHEEIGSAAIQLAGETKAGDHELKDVRIAKLSPISSPNEVIAQIPQKPESSSTVEEGRRKIVEIMSREPRDDRLLVIIGPCSIHDPEAAEEYAEWVSKQRQVHAADLEIVMRAYLEKPRTTVGWKGLINDPHIDGSFAISEGLLTARNLLHGITSKGVPIATELLDTSTPQYIDDMISYGAIGARTTESQLHRELVSGTSFPVGFKNGTGGSIQIAINAIKSAAAPHSFIGLDRDGHSAVVETKGNEDCHIILRGSSKGPNYSSDTVKNISDELSSSGVSTAIIIDVSHANSGKKHHMQTNVSKSVAAQVAQGNKDIRGVMIESNLKEGSQKPNSKDKLVYGQSITDACAGLDDSATMLEDLAKAVRERRGHI